MAPAAPSDSPAPPPAAAPARRAGRIGFVLLLLFIGALLALAGATWHAWRSPATLPWLLQQVPGMQVHGVQGTLADRRLQVERLDWQLPGGAGRLQLWQLDLEAGSLVLLPRSGTWAALRLKQVQAARAQFDSPPPDGKPLTPPDSLQLPVDLQIDRLGIGALQIDAQPAITGLQAALSLGADGGTRHRIDGLQLVLETGSATAPAPLALRGKLDIGTAAPLPVDARIEADAPARDALPAWQGRVKLQGPLTKLQADMALSGTTPDAPKLQASSTLLPFAAWPLGALDLRTEALNLAALSPQLPATRLSGSATLQTQGLDRPASLNATLDNGLPGAWDAGRLPLRRLQLDASGRPDQVDRLTLQRFELLLGDAAGPAGKVAGDGTWQGATLALRLQINGLQPARLHRQAAQALLDGPLTVQVRGLPTEAAPNSTPVVAVDGTLTGRWTGATPTTGGLPAVQLRLAGEASARHLLVTRAEARSGPAAPDGRPALARLSGRADADGSGWRIAGQASLVDFDPRPWWRGPEGSAWRRGPHRLQAEAEAKLTWRPATSTGTALDRLLASLQGDARLKLGDSLLVGVPLSGEATLRRDGTAGAARLQASLTAGGNRIDLQGDTAPATGRTSTALAGDRWSATLQAPNLATLAPLRTLLAELLPAQAEAIASAWPTTGKLQGALQAQGRWPALQSEGSLQATQLATADAQLQQATLRWRQGARLDAPLQIDLDARGLHSGAQRVDALRLNVDGTLAAHQIRLHADSPLRPPAWTEQFLGPSGTGSQLDVEARGQWLAATAGTRPAAGPSYQLRAVTLNGGARAAGKGSTPWLAAQDLAATLQLDAALAPLSLQLAPGRLQLPGTALRWREAGWSASGDGLLVLAGTLESIDATAVMQRLQPDMGWTGDLVVGGQVDLRRTGHSLDLDLQLVRSGGDLAVSDDLGQRQALGLSELRLALSAHGGQWQFAHGLVGQRIGSLVGAVALRNPANAASPLPQPDAVLQGLAEARVADLSVWGTWVPPGWRLSGAMDAVVQFGGTLGAPRITGNMRGRGLGVRNLLEGVALSDGELALELNGDEARIERLHFAGGDGRLEITGGATLGAQPRLALQLVAERFRVLGRLDRRVIASGQASLVLAQRQLQIDGDLRIDEGLIDIGQGGAPTLDADVRVRRGADAAASAPNYVAAAPTRPGTAPEPMQVQMRVTVDMGNRLQLRGMGVDTRLSGKLVLGTSGGKLTVNGTVATEDGRYAAYGQKLEISRGRFIFSGEPGNPRIDVLAIRPNLDVLVGVLVDGTALSPRIRLHSEPDLADYDKLSWLVLGRSPDGLGSADTALLQRAAFALLSGQGPGPTDQFLQAIGLTDFSLRQSEGDTRDTIISLGRQLSRRWYVGYERGVHATTGTWQLIYRVAQRFTLRAQSGSENAIDLIWTWRW